MIFIKSTEVRNHHHHPVWEHVHHPNWIPHSHLQWIPFPTLSPKQPLIYYLFISIDLPLLVNFIHGQWTKKYLGKFLQIFPQTFAVNILCGLHMEWQRFQPTYAFIFFPIEISTSIQRLWHLPVSIFWPNSSSPLSWNFPSKRYGLVILGRKKICVQSCDKITNWTNQDHKLCHVGSLLHILKAQFNIECYF